MAENRQRAECSKLERSSGPPSLKEWLCRENGSPGLPWDGFQEFDKPVVGVALFRSRDPERMVRVAVSIGGSGGSREGPGAAQMPFTVEYGPRAFSGVALVDSGADGVAFPLSYARALEVDLSKTRAHRTQGVGGSAVAYDATVTLHVTLCGREFHYPVTASFSDGVQEVGLLGQRGFLDHFHVAFRKAEGIFAVELPAESQPK